MASYFRSILARAVVLPAIALFGLRAAAAEPQRSLAIEAPAAGGAAADWTHWAPRPELAHEHAIVGRNGANTLMLRSRGFECYGFWSRRVTDIVPGQWYAFSAGYEAEGLDRSGGHAFAVLSWYGDPNGTRELQRDYIDRHETDGAATRLSRVLQAPAGATLLRVELGLRRVAKGTVYWRDVRLVDSPPPAPRLVRVATTRALPTFPATIEANKRLMADIVDRAAADRPDIVLLSENLSTRGVKLPLAEKAETIPGPLTNMLAEKAKKYRTYLITTLLERNGSLFHNTAVVIDRNGRLAGTYRKVHLTISEMENGLTPGSSFPIFETDLGRIGIVTCWDNWFSESMRILRLRGAEIVFMPLAGDGDPAHWQAVWPARAIDNGVYLVTSSTVTDAPSRIFDPTGAIVAETKDRFGHAMAELDLNREWRLRYLSIGSGAGEGRSLYLRERRPDMYGPLMRDSDPLPVRPESGN